MKTKNIIACLLLLFVAQAVSAQNNAEALVRIMVDQVKSHKNVEMAFTYQISPDGKNFSDAQEGHAWLQGNAYKIEMAEQQSISDGTTIWTYLVDDEEVMVSDATEGDDNTPLKLLTSLDKNYVATLTNIDNQGNATIELANPKGQYKRVTLKMNAMKAELKSSDVYLEDGTKVAVTVKEMKYDQNLDDKFFTFDTKKHPNVEVIDMR
jgi:outer membrane lipoprotein-sorting protein